MEEYTKVSMLLDFYGNMLTQKQKDVMELYYNYDLSLAEIAENKNITRQGVRDLIKRGEQILMNTEEKLGILNKYNDLDSKLRSLLMNIDNIYVKYKNDSQKYENIITEDIYKIRQQLIEILNTIEI